MSLGGARRGRRARAGEGSALRRMTLPIPHMLAHGDCLAYSPTLVPRLFVNPRGYAGEKPPPLAVTCLAKRGGSTRPGTSPAQAGRFPRCEQRMDRAFVRSDIAGACPAQGRAAPGVGGGAGSVGCCCCSARSPADVRTRRATPPARTPARVRCALANSSRPMPIAWPPWPCATTCKASTSCSGSYTSAIPPNGRRPACRARPTPSWRSAGPSSRTANSATWAAAATSPHCPTPSIRRSRATASVPSSTPWPAC